jgi:hypothetical protein
VTVTLYNLHITHFSEKEIISKHTLRFFLLERFKSLCLAALHVTLVVKVRAGAAHTKNQDSSFWGWCGWVISLLPMAATVKRN